MDAATIGAIFAGIGVVISAMSPIILAIINRNQQLANARREAIAAMAADKVESVRTDLQSHTAAVAEKLDHIGAGLGEVQDTVNGNTSRMVQAADAMHEQVAQLRVDKARLEDAAATKAAKE